MSTSTQGLLIALLFVETASAQTTERVSVDSSGMQGNAANPIFVDRPTLSVDNRFVAFASRSSNLVAGDTNGAQDVFVRDLQTNQTTRESVSSTGLEGNGNAGFPSISADGRFVAFDSSASNLVANDTNAKLDIFVHDRQLGQTTRVSVDPAGVEGNHHSSSCSISADGRFVAFDSFASNLVSGDTNTETDVFVHDRQTGQIVRASLASSGVEGDGLSISAALSDHGRFVAFESLASNLVAGDTNLMPDVFVRDLQNGVTRRVSVSSSGTQGDSGATGPVAISADGRFVAFTSGSTNLVPGPTGFVSHVYVHDQQTGTTTRVSVDSTGARGNGNSSDPALSGDGRYVAFQSDSTNLIAGDSNAATDVFLHDRLLGITTRVSVDSAGAGGNAASNLAGIARDGRRVAFFSVASNLVAGDTNASQDVFLRDRGPQVVTAYCAGDGLFVPCPCGNDGQPGRGCLNSFMTGGGLLAAQGDASLSADTLRLDSSGLPPTSSALFMQGELQENGGVGTLYGDGLLCISGSLIRMGTRAASGGSVSFGAGVPLDPMISVRGQIPLAGASRVYQVRYRNSASFCTPATFNTTNALLVSWTP